MGKSQFMAQVSKINRFNEAVLSKFKIYNSIFTALPYEQSTQTGMYLPLFHRLCEESYKEGLSPDEIVNKFFKQYFQAFKEEEQIDYPFPIYSIHREASCSF